MICTGVAMILVSLIGLTATHKHRNKPRVEGLRAICVGWGILGFLSALVGCVGMPAVEKSEEPTAPPIQQLTFRMSQQFHMVRIEPEFPPEKSNAIAAEVKALLEEVSGREVEIDRPYPILSSVCFWIMVSGAKDQLELEAKFQSLIKNSPENGLRMKSGFRITEYEIWWQAGDDSVRPSGLKIDPR